MKKNSQKRMSLIGGKIERRLQDEGINYNYEKDICPAIYDYLVEYNLSNDAIVEEIVQDFISIHNNLG